MPWRRKAEPINPAKLPKTPDAAAAKEIKEARRIRLSDVLDLEAERMEGEGGPPSGFVRPRGMGDVGKDRK
jgi:hypothetical protein